MAIVLVEQYFEFARDLADSFILMDRGEVVASGDRSGLDGDDVRRLMAI
jgi:urea transport system ATP-binding protein